MYSCTKSRWHYWSFRGITTTQGTLLSSLDFFKSAGKIYLAREQDIFLASIQWKWWWFGHSTGVYPLDKYISCSESKGLFLDISIGLGDFQRKKRLRTGSKNGESRRLLKGPKKGQTHRLTFRTFVLLPLLIILFGRVGQRTSRLVFWNWRADGRPQGNI